jgi:NADPH:quinone reductase-like Zn-dependent oxidoreductase
MKAAVVARYGTVAVEDVEPPQPAEGEVLVRVRASSVNAADWYGFAGRPYAGRILMGLLHPKSPRAGTDFAGVVEAIGGGVGRYAPGDEVYGCKNGAYAEYVTAGDAVAPKPKSLSFEEAAAVPLAALTALQGLRDHGKVQAGRRVLVNGASGGVGTFAVQLAKALGAEVHAVCSGPNVEQARALGAEHVFDYTREDFTQSGERYDVLFDNAGTRSWRAMRRVVQPGGTVVLVGGPRSKRLLGPLGHLLRVKLASTHDSRRAVFFIAKPNGEDLATLGELSDAGRISPVVEHRYGLTEIAAAMRRMGAGHVRGKLVVTVP